MNTLTTANSDGTPQALDKTSSSGMHPAAGRIEITLATVRDRAVLNLRTNPSGSAVPARILAALGLMLPEKVFGSATVNLQGTAAGTATTALWIGPGEWLMVCQDPSLSLLAAALSNALEGEPGALTDVGHGYAIFSVTGNFAPEVLAQGCGLDLDPAVFLPGHCAMTGLGKLRVVIHRLPAAAGAPPDFEIYVSRSFASSLWEFLCTASTEFGYRVAGAMEKTQ